MKRRSFLGFLLAAPVAAPAMAKAIASAEGLPSGSASQFTLTADKFISLRGDMIIDGTITATQMSAGSITSYTGAISTLHVGSLKICCLTEGSKNDA